MDKALNSKFSSVAQCVDALQISSYLIVNTPAHIVFGLAALGPTRAGSYPLAIVAGALIPDLAMIVFYAWHKLIGTVESEIWSQHYFHDSWQMVFDIPNSIPLIAVALSIFCWRKKIVLTYMFASMLCHCVLDLLVHHDDAHRHFYPFLEWRFVSPVSYWDASHYGDIVSKIEMVSVVVLSIWLWRTVGNLITKPSQVERLKVTLVTTNLLYIAYFFYVITVWM